MSDIPAQDADRLEDSTSAPGTEDLGIPSVGGNARGQGLGEDALGLVDGSVDTPVP